MILAALASYYDQLLKDGRLPEPGWNPHRVAFDLEISEAGDLRAVISLGDKGTERAIPEQAKRTVKVIANFLCDTSSYLLGVDAKGKPDRAKLCFGASREMHHRVLDGVDSPVARAILAYFDSWKPELAMEHETIMRAGDKLLAGGMLTFTVIKQNGEIVHASDDPAIRAAWRRWSESPESDAPVMTCLVTGKHGPIARLHPSIKGVIGAQSSGATLVGFNAPAFESYGHAIDQGCGQGCNAPVSEEVARAYGAALNYLLSKSEHRVRLGDTTVVFWSERKDDENCDLFVTLLGGMPSAQTDAEGIDKQISEIMKSLASGHRVGAEGVDLNARFYVLGLAPNASRLSVRFFLRNDFGSMLAHVAEHYRRLELYHKFGRDWPTPYFLLRAVENENAKKPVVSSVLVSGLLRSIIEGARYPEALYENVLLRIRATRRVTHERAAIIKAFLLRNRGFSKEELTVELNEQTEERAYALGRVFAILEQIQNQANGAATITSRYLDSASTTPGLVYPALLRLATAHLEKIKRDAPGLAAYFSRSLSELLWKGNEPHAFPKRFSLDEQGCFFLGYYQQKWKSGKKDSEESAGTDTTQEA